MSRLVNVVCPHCDAVSQVPQARLQQLPYCGQCNADLFTGRPVDLNKANFERQLGGGDLPVVVLFWSSWSPISQAMANAMERAAASLEPEVRLARLNIAEVPHVAGRFDIDVTPCMVVLRHGREIRRRKGAMPLLEMLGWIGDQCKEDFHADHAAHHEATT